MEIDYYKNRFSTFLQKEDWDCGPGSVQLFLQNMGISKVDYTALTQNLRCDWTGTWPHRFSRFFIYNVQFKVTERVQNTTLEDLRRETQKGNACIVLYQTWGSKDEQAGFQCGHYSLVVGVDGQTDPGDEEKVIMLDPGMDLDGGYGVGWHAIPAKEFEQRWIDKWTEKTGIATCARWMLSIEAPRHYRGVHLEDSTDNKWVR